MYFILFLHTINIFLMVDKTWFFVHKYILLIQLHVMDNFCDEQKNMECNIREIKIRNFY